MRQVLFWIPIPTPWSENIPVYGFGTMLVVAIFLCTWLASRLAKKEGIAKERIQDLAFWVVIAGIIGARLTFMIQYKRPLSEFLLLWEGGLVFYGSLIGGLVGYVLAYYFVLSKYYLSWRKVADVIAPAAALGLCLGRVGCLLNSCCYGDVACPDCKGLQFPLSAFPRYDLVRKGYQTAAGFTTEAVGEERSALVTAVDPHSPAATVAHLRAGDVLVEAASPTRSQPIKTVNDLDSFLTLDWPRGEKELTLTVLRDGERITLPAFAPVTLALYPTQVYESVSTGLLFLVLLAFYPLRRHDGEVMALFLIGYSIHRFLNEWLRNDTDPVAFGMTLSQNGSLLVFLAGVVMLLWLWRKPVQYPLPKTA